MVGKNLKKNNRAARLFSTLEYLDEPGIVEIPHYSLETIFFDSSRNLWTLNGPNNPNQSKSHILFGTTPILRQQWVGRVSKMAIFAHVQYCICADKVGRWGLKRPKICWRNSIRMVLFIKRAHFIRRTMCVTILTGIFVASQAKYLYWESMKHTIKGHFSYFFMKPCGFLEFEIWAI